MSKTREIPYFNYKFLWQSDRQGLLPVIEEICSRGAFILQKDLEEFEKKLADFAGAKYALGVADGTSAITIALIAAGIQDGDEVIFCSHTFIATASAIYQARGVPIPVEVGPDRLIDYSKIEGAVTKKTKFIVPTQLNGRVCNMDILQQIADKHNLKIVEDAAQALGAKFKGKCAGTFGQAGTISFFPAKSLGCFGDGGAILTNSEKIYETMKSMRDHGRGANGEVVMWGINSRLDNLQAGILNYKLGNFPKVIEYRRKLAGLYDQLLSDISTLGLPPAPGGDNHFDTYQNYEIEAENRDKLQSYLRDHGIGTLIQWGGWPVHAFKKLGFTQSLPVTENFFKKCILLPMNISLSEEDVRYVATTIRNFYNQ